MDRSTQYAIKLMAAIITIAAVGLCVHLGVAHDRSAKRAEDAQLAPCRATPHSRAEMERLLSACLANTAGR